MLITRDHRTWSAATLVATGGLTAAYVWAVQRAPFGASGGSWPGLAFGVLGTICMLAATLLSARKRVRTRRFGPAQTWMRVHIWLGLLAVPCIWFHSGFRLGGALTTVLMTLFYVVIVSGVVGLALQQVLPGVLTRRVRNERPLGQIDHVLRVLAVDAYELVASIAGPIEEATDERQALTDEESLIKAQPGAWKPVPRQRPAEDAPPAAAAIRRAYVEAIRPFLRGGGRGDVPDLQRLRLAAPDEWGMKIERLDQLCEEARELAMQRRLHAWLHNWLFIHAPLSLTVLVLTVVHVIYALSY